MLRLKARIAILQRLDGLCKKERLYSEDAMYVSEASHVTFCISHFRVLPVTYADTADSARSEYYQHYASSCK